MIFLLAALMLTAIAACSTDDDDSGAGSSSGSFDDEDVIADYADEVIVPTYQWLADEAANLLDAVDALDADTTDGNLATAQQAWRDTRLPWEQSEGFLFGPVDSFGYDPALDSWPVNKTDLDAVLADSDDLTVDYVRNLGEGLQGFHTVEYLLFGAVNDKDAADFTARELQYLTSSTTVLAEIAANLATSWTEGIDDSAPYRDTFATAGQDGNTAYPSYSSAAQEIVLAMVGICDEVANGKIADPYDAGDVTLVESQFSFNSLTDFKSNITSIQNGYMGDVAGAGTSGKGMNEWVASVDSDLDDTIQTQIQAAIDALDEIAEPFRDSITDPDQAANIEAAQEAINTLANTLQDELVPLIQE
ncbi:peptidase M75 [bacterium]|nr:peptidase M75 [bacterium]